MKKTIGYLFVSLLLVSTCHACGQRTVPGDTTLQHSNGKKVRPIGGDTLDSALQIKEVKLDYDIQKKDSYGRRLTYALLEEHPYINSEIMKSDYAPVLIVPPNVTYQESFVSLEQDAREQKIGPWRGGVKADPKKLIYNFNAEDATGLGDVRVVKPKIGVEYKISENSAVGVEASRGIHDPGDASAWGKSVKDEKAAQIKYKILF